MADVLGIIAARGGSKRIPRKNLRDLGGKPLLAYAIEHAMAAERIDRGIVSTDDDEISRVARDHGGDVPFERPPELATDTATTDEVVLHALEWLSDRGETYDVVCSIPVTTPFREPGDVDGAIGHLLDVGAQSVVGVTEFDPPPFWAVESGDDGFLRPHFGGEYMWSKTRTQEVPALMRPNGAVFAATVEAFREQEGFYTDLTAGYEMPPERSIDVDEPFDMKVARALMEYE